MSNDKTLATVKHGGCVQLGDGLLPCPFCGNGAEFVPYKNNGLTLKCKSMGCVQRHQRTLRYGIEWLRTSMTEHWNARALSAQPSPGGQDALASELLAHAEGLERMAAGDRETGLSIEQAIEDGEGYTPDEATDVAAGLQHDAERGEETAALLRKAATALAARQPVGEPIGHLYRVVVSDAGASRPWAGPRVIYTEGPAPFEGRSRNGQYLNVYAAPPGGAK